MISDTDNAIALPENRHSSRTRVRSLYEVLHNAKHHHGKDV